MLDLLIGAVALILVALFFLMMIGAVMAFASIASDVVDAALGKRCCRSCRCADHDAPAEAD